MKFDLYICVSEEILEDWKAVDVAAMFSAVELPQVEDSATFAVSFVDNPDLLFAIIEENITRNKSGSCIVMSDAFVEVTTNRRQENDLAKKLEILFRTNSCCCGLIALSPQPLTHNRILDGVVVSDVGKPERIRQKLIQVATRLWFKSPLPKSYNRREDSQAVIEFSPVSSCQQLRACMELRAKVYGALGYLHEEDSAPGPRVEMDGFDPVALHMKVVDKRQGELVVGTARLIVPSIRAQASRSSWVQLLDSYDRWCEEIAVLEDTPELLQILESPPPYSLPIFDSFNYFEQLHDCILNFKHGVDPDLCCELSRVVVDPMYRGLGISRLLIDKAIENSNALCRQHMLIECAPHHEAMYRKFGFKTIQDDKVKYYARPQRLDTYAVAMRRESDSTTANGKGNFNAKQIAAQYNIFVDDGPANGCRLSVSSSTLDHRELSDLLEQPIPRYLHNVTATDAMHSCPNYVSRSSKVSFSGIALAALKSGSIIGFVRALRPVVATRAIDSVRLMDKFDHAFSLSLQELNLEQPLALASRLENWLEATHG